MFQKCFGKLIPEEHSYLEKLVSSCKAFARKLRCSRILLESNSSESGEYP